LDKVDRVIAAVECSCTGFVVVALSAYDCLLCRLQIDRDSCVGGDEAIVVPCEVSEVAVGDIEEVCDGGGICPCWAEPRAVVGNGFGFILRETGSEFARLGFGEVIGLHLLLQVGSILFVCGGESFCLCFIGFDALSCGVNSFDLAQIDPLIQIRGFDAAIGVFEMLLLLVESSFDEGWLRVSVAASRVESW
jgi:hypothetical protein